MSQTAVSQTCWIMGLIGGAALTYDQPIGFIVFIVATGIAIVVDVSNIK